MIDENNGNSVVAWAQRAYRGGCGECSGNEECAREQKIVRASDGYVRKTPVQEIRIPKGYRAQRIKRAIAICIGICFAVLVIYVFFRFVVFG